MSIPYIISPVFKIQEKMQLTLLLLSSLMNGNSLRVALTVSGSYRRSQYEISV